MIFINETLLSYADRYFKQFGNQLPLRMLPQTMTNEELYKAIDDCIDRECDDLVAQFTDVDNTDILL